MKHSVWRVGGFFLCRSIKESVERVVHLGRKFGKEVCVISYRLFEWGGKVPIMGEVGGLEGLWCGGSIVGVEWVCGGIPEVGWCAV